MPGIQNKSGKRYITIIGGKFKQKVDKETKGAKLREYELKDGTKGSKWELEYSGWVGKITEVEIKKTKYGKVLSISFDDVVVQINKASRYFADILQKLPNINPNLEVTLSPYDFEDEKIGKKFVGVSVVQNKEKIPSFFYDGKQNINGLPIPPDNIDWQDEDERNTYFSQRDLFLIEYLETQVAPKFQSNVMEEIQEEAVQAEAPTTGGINHASIGTEDPEEIKVEDIPF